MTKILLALVMAPFLAALVKADEHSDAVTALNAPAAHIEPSVLKNRGVRYFLTKGAEKLTRKEFERLFEAGNTVARVRLMYVARRVKPTEYPRGFLGEVGYRGRLNLSQELVYMARVACQGMMRFQQRLPDGRRVLRIHYACARVARASMERGLALSAARKKPLRDILLFDAVLDSPALRAERADVVYRWLREILPPKPNLDDLRVVVQRDRHLGRLILERARAGYARQEIAPVVLAHCVHMWAPVEAQAPDTAVATDRHRIRFQVAGKLDDPMLGNIEDIVTARLRRLGLRGIEVKRGDGAFLDVAFQPSTRAPIARVKQVLARPDTVSVALAATRDVIKAVFGPDFDDDALLRWMRGADRVSTDDAGLPLYRNPDDPTRPKAVGEKPLLRYYPWFSTVKSGHEIPGVLVLAGPETSVANVELDKITAWDAKLTAGISVVVKPKARSRLREFAGRTGELCVILNGRCALRLPKGGGPMAKAALDVSGRIDVCTSLVGADLSDGAAVFRKWVKSGEHKRRLTPLSARATKKK